ncbi:MAG: hypothetical protein M9908_04945 [Phyllobacteriaceae bacterium]|nr:hypothetical protein [Phyllobacteriaceae bacterium]
MKSRFKVPLAAAFALLALGPAQASESDLAVARELAELKAALEEIRQAANEDARYVLPLRTNMQLARISAECAGEGSDQAQPGAVCDPLPADLEAAADEPMLAF